MGRLFWKFFLAFQLSLLLAAGSVGVFVWVYAASRNEQLNMDPRSDFIVKLAANTLKHGGELALRESLQDMEGPDQVFVVDAHGKELLGRTVAPTSVATARAAAASEHPHFSARLVEGQDGNSLLLFIPPRAFRPPMLMGANFFPPPRGTPPGAPRFEAGRLPPPLPWLNIIAGLLASLGFSALLAWYVVRPIRHLRQAFQAVTAGQLGTRVKETLGRRRDEFAELGQDFDTMTQQLESLIATQRRLFHDVSHELRSPLARLQAAIGLAHQDPDKLAITLERVERETRRLDELVDELLTLARLESGMPGPLDEVMEMVGLLQDIVHDASFEAENQGRQVSFAGQGQAAIRGRGTLICRALENVIRNGIKYAPAGTTVEVEAGRDAGGKQLLIQVMDRGSGVRENELEAIFEPFFRGAERESQNGYGLGLAIARRAIEAHGGAIQASNRPGGGLSLRINLPLLQT